MPVGTVDFDEGLYQEIYVLLNFKKEDDVNRMEEKMQIKADPDDEDIKDIVIDDERDHNWKMVFEDNEAGRDDENL